MTLIHLARKMTSLILNLHKTHLKHSNATLSTQRKYTSYILIFDILLPKCRDKLTKMYENSCQYLVEVLHIIKIIYYSNIIIIAIYFIVVVGP